MNLVVAILVLILSFAVIVPLFYYGFGVRSYTVPAVVVVLTCAGLLTLLDYIIISDYIKPVNTPTTTLTKPTEDINKPYYTIDQSILSDNKMPLNGLPPNELFQKLGPVHRALSQPIKPISYQNVVTTSDKGLIADNSIVIDGTKDADRMALARIYYPNLTANQVNARDCLNSMGPDSCFQSAKMFEKANTILDKGITKDNAPLILKEDFMSFAYPSGGPASVEIVHDKMRPLFINAPGIPGKQRNIMQNKCRGCKIGICEDNYCALDNELFM